jgi:hypothetical protein
VKLAQALDDAGWLDVEVVYDDSSFILATSPIGTRWAIAVAERGDHMRQQHLEFDIDVDGRATKVAFVEPLDAVDAAALVSALSERES